MWRDNDVRGYGEGVRTDRASKGAVAFVAMLAQGQLRRPTLERLLADCEPNQAAVTRPKRTPGRVKRP